MARVRGFFAVAARLGKFLVDALLLAQVVGVVAGVLWWAGLTPDVLGFLMIGGAAAGIVSCFVVFVPYALLYLWKSPSRYWRSLHPVNIGVALVVFSADWLWFSILPSDKMMTAYAAGGILAILGGRQLVARPRFLLATAVIWMLLLTVAGGWRLALVGGSGVFLLALALQVAIRNIGKPATVNG